MNNIIHHNIKNGNFFLYENNKIKLGGFNLCEYQKESLLKDLFSSLNYFYSPPEIIKKESYDSNCDIWSIGMCIYEMCFSSSDFCQVDFYSNLLKGKINFNENDIYSCELFEIISLMLKNNKLSRPNINQLLNNSIILNHIYNPMKYLNVLSFGSGWIIDKIPFIEDLDLRNYLMKKKNIIDNNNINKVKYYHKEKRKSIKSMQIGIKNENLLIKTDLDISLNFNNGKSISNERCNSCKHLKRLKKKNQEKKEEYLIYSKIKSTNNKFTSPRNFNGIFNQNTNFSTSYPIDFYKKNKQKKNDSVPKLYKNIINKVIENKNTKNNLKKHLSFNFSNNYKDKNIKGKSSIKKKLK